MLPREKLDNLTAELEELNGKLSDPAVIADTRGYRELMRRFKELNEINAEWARYQELEKQIQGAEHLLQTESDAEMEELARLELEDLQQKLEQSELKLRDLLIPSDPNDGKNAIVEIRAGTGGEEAALFVADLYRMYSYFAEQKGWKLQLLDLNETGLGGYKEIIFQLNGEDAYGLMRFESGVHRVQRIPVTESSGRIHTSAVSVAVLPEAEEVDVVINDNDLRVDVYRSTGHGGGGAVRAFGPRSVRAGDIPAHVFGGHTLVASQLGNGHSWALTEFRIGADGFERMLVIAPPGTTDTRAGRITQRLLELETYRLMALRGVPVAKALGPMLSQAESALSDITARLESKSASDQDLLDTLVSLAAQVVILPAASRRAMSARSICRLLACRSGSRAAQTLPDRVSSRVATGSSSPRTCRVRARCGKSA